MSATEVPWYKSALEECNRRTRAYEVAATAILSHSESLGEGDVDTILLSKGFKDVQTYTSIEPNEQQLGVFKERLTATGRTGIKMNMIAKRVEDWEGPSEPVDVILLIHVLYHIKDKQALIRRCLNWLKPGGTLLVAHGGDDIFFVPIAEEFGVHEELYTAKDVRQDFKSVAANINEFQCYIEFDVRDRHPDVMNFLLQRQATKEEVDALDKFLHKILPSGVETQAIMMFWTNKI